MKNERKQNGYAVATASTQSGIETAYIGHPDDATKSAPQTSDEPIGLVSRVEILTASHDDTLSMDLMNNTVISIGERVADGAREVRVFHRVDDRVGRYFTAQNGEVPQIYARAGQFVANQMIKAKSWTYEIVADTPVSEDNTQPYKIPHPNNLTAFKRMLDETLRNSRL